AVQVGSQALRTQVDGREGRPAEAAEQARSEEERLHRRVAPLAGATGEGEGDREGLGGEALLQARGRIDDRAHARPARRGRAPGPDRLRELAAARGGGG